MFNGNAAPSDAAEAAPSTRVYNKTMFDGMLTI